MKFEDLDFKPHGITGGTHAVVNFPNGYGASVVSGPMFYTRPGAPYELAVMRDESLCYDTELTDDVLGYLTAEDVTMYLEKIEALAP